MSRPKPITISAAQCEEFRQKFIHPATVLTLHESASFTGLDEVHFKALEAYGMLCDAKQDFTLQAEDVAFARRFQQLFAHFAKPIQKELFGDKLHAQIVTANEYLTGLLPQTVSTQPER